MALVIFCVDFTLLMRVRRSFRLGMARLYPVFLSRHGRA
jgi:hypothetical protein